MSSLPSVMQARKVQLLQATLPALDTKQPVEHQPKALVEAPPLTPEELAVFEAGSEVTETPPNGAPASAPAPSPASTTVTTTSAPAPSEEDKELKWKYTSLLGTHDTIIRENRAMRDDVVKLEERVAALSKQNLVAPPAPAPALDLSPAELAEYETSLPVINKVAEKVATARAQQLIQDAVTPLLAEIADLRKAGDTNAARVTSENEGIFLSNVKRTVKDMDNIVKTPEWATFIASPVSRYSNQTIGQALWAAHKQKDIDIVTSVFEDFAKSRVAASPADAYRAPTMTGASATPADTSKKPMLKLSERKKASDQFRKGQITRDKYEQIKNLYNQAESENRIDYSK